MKIAFIAISDRAWNDSNLETGLGGSETMVVRYARELARIGHEVTCFTKSSNTVAASGVVWRPMETGLSFDLAIALRSPESLSLVSAPIRALLANDQQCPTLSAAVASGLCNLIIVISEYQKRLYQKLYPEIPESMYFVGSAGVAWGEYAEPVEKTEGLCIYMSTPERGLNNLIKVWPEIVRRHDAARLFVTSGFQLYGWSDDIARRESHGLYDALGKCGDTVRYLGPISRTQLLAQQRRARLFIYPTNYLENCCIAALEASAARMPIVTTGIGALNERVKHGETGYLLDSPAGTAEYNEQFITVVVGLLERTSLMNKLGEAGREFVREHDYAVQAGKLMAAVLSL